MNGMEPQAIDDFTWRVGGPQGGGIETAATLFAQALARGGWWVSARREYHSNIMGRHSYLDVRAARRPTRAFFERVDLLAALDAETLARHLDEVKPGGVLVYDPDAARMPLSKLPMLDGAAYKRISAALGGGDPVLEHALERYRESGVRLVPLALEPLAREVGEAVGADAITAKKTLNTVAVAASLALLGYPLEFLDAALADQFVAKPKVAELNRKVAAEVYRRVEPLADVALEPIGSPGERIYINGSHASAMGKVAAGLGFMSYYPITPATDEPFYLEAHPESGVVVVQVEDELAAVNMAIGASMAGARAALTTSGPGFALMTEALGFAGLTETPLVISLYQRGGPSTGLPTRTEQGDLRFALGAGHGDYPRAVLASASVEDAFANAALAMNVAARFQLPVVHLMDKYLASTTRVVEPFDTGAVVPDQGVVATDAKGVFPRFSLAAEGGVSPRIPVGTPGAGYWITSDEHDEIGHITEDPELRDAMMEKRAAKIEALRKWLGPEEMYRTHKPEAGTLVLGWGSTEGVALEAMEGLDMGYVQVRFLLPFPDLEALLEGKRLAVLEYNQSGQFARLLAQETGRSPDHLIVKYNGRPMTIEEVRTAFEAVLSGEAGAYTVLRAGV
ncbi:2-oxoacid:acceptor oxidoreductase subunit alpha [Oceanithermus sp.]